LTFQLYHETSEKDLISLNDVDEFSLLYLQKRVLLYLQ